MSSDWKNIWDPRAHAFNFACEKHPSARDEERNPLIDLLRIAPGVDFLEVAPCGGCLLRGVNERHPSGVRYHAVEPSDENAKDMPTYVTRVEGSDVTAFALEDSCMDRVGNLAGLHHTFPRMEFYTESFRVLRPGGILALADVLEDSDVARWLNEFVNQYNEYGHHGIFFPEGEMTASFKEAGFQEVTEKSLKFAWRFKAVADAVEFCRNLFHLNKASDAQIQEGLVRYLGLEIANDDVRIPWQLLYASGRKPQQ